MVETIGSSVALGKDALPAQGTHANTRLHQSIQRVAFSRLQGKKGSASPSDYWVAVGLTWRCMSEVQSSGLAQIVSDVKQRKLPWLSFVHTFDGTSHNMLFPKELSKVFFGWMIDELQEHYSRFLSDTDIKTISAALSTNRAAVAHVQEQGIMMITPGKNDNGALHICKSRVFIRGMILQRGTTSCNLQSLDQGCPELSQAQIKILSEFLTIVMPMYCLDSSIVNVRLSHEIICSYRSYPNVVPCFMWCKAHDIANALKELMVDNHIIPFLRSFSNIIKQKEYCEVWLAHMIEAMPSTFPIMRAPRPSSPNLEAASCAFIEFVARMTCYRSFAVTSRSHELSELSEERIQRKMKDVEEGVARLKEFLFFRPDRGLECSIYVEGGETNGEIYADLTLALSPILRHMLPSGLVSLSRWESDSPFIALCAFLVLLNMLGISAWHLAYRPDYVRSLEVHAERPGVSLFAKENAQSLRKISQGFKDPEFHITITILNLAVFHMDAFLRYLQKADSSPPDKKQTPLLFQLLSPDIRHNPYLVCQKDLSTLITADGQLGQLLLIWYRHFKADMGWWIKWSLVSLGMIGQLLGQVEFRFGHPFKEGPYLLFLPAANRYIHGHMSIEHRSAVHKLWNMNECDLHEVVTKFRANLVTKNEWLEGPNADCVFNAGCQSRVINTVSERQHAFVRQENWGKHSRSVTTLANACACKAWGREHLFRGGQIPRQVHDRDFKSFGVDTFAKRRSRDASKRRGTGSNMAFILYWKDCCERWRAALGTSTRKRFASGQPNRPIWIKGKFISFKQYSGACLAKYKASELLQMHWRAIARNHSNQQKEAPASRKRKLADCNTIWQAGSHSTPIRPDIVDNIVAKYTKHTVAGHPCAVRIPGPITSGRRIVEEDQAQHRLLCKDPNPPNMTLHPLEIKRTCFEDTPGLCQHSNFFVMIKRVASNLVTLISGKPKSILHARTVQFDCYVDIVHHHRFFMVLMDARFARPVVNYWARTTDKSTPEDKRFKLNFTSSGIIDVKSIFESLHYEFEEVHKAWPEGENITSIIVTEVLACPQRKKDMTEWRDYSFASYPDVRKQLWIDRLPLSVSIWPDALDPSLRLGRKSSKPTDSIDKVFDKVKSLDSIKEKCKEHWQKLVEKHKSAHDNFFKKKGKVKKTNTLSFEESDCSDEEPCPHTKPVFDSWEGVSDPTPSDPGTTPGPAAPIPTPSVPGPTPGPAVPAPAPSDPGPTPGPAVAAPMSSDPDPTPGFAVPAPTPSSDPCPTPGPAPAPTPSDPSAARVKKNKRKVWLMDRWFVSLNGNIHVVNGFASGGMALPCRHHPDEDCWRDCRFGAVSPMSVEECCKRLLRWEEDGQHCPDKASHKENFGTSRLLAEYASPP